MHLTYKYRLLPSKKQHQALAATCEAQRLLYNAALEERVDCYAKTGKGLNYIAQCNGLTQWRKSDLDAASTPLKLQRWTLKRLDDAYRAFFRRVRMRNGKAGFPRFRGQGRWNAFGFHEFVGIRFDGRRLRFAGMPGGLRVHLHRPLPKDAKIKSCVFRRDHKGWSVCFQIAVPVADRRVVSDAVGIDVGIKTLAATSDGLLIPNPRHARRAERELRRRQRALTRAKRGSNERRKTRKQVARLHAKVANTRATSLHQISAMLVNRYDVIAVEALNTKGLAKSRLARDVHDASWSKLRELLRYKAERAGAHFIEVDPKFSSQTCPECGNVKAKTLAERTHQCACGYTADRDVAAARVIMSRAVANPGVQNVTGCGVRAPRKLIDTLS